MDRLKHQISELMKGAFKEGKPIGDGDEGYYIITDDPLSMQIKVDTIHGPRFFTVKLTEHY